MPLSDEPLSTQIARWCALASVMTPFAHGQASTEVWLSIGWRGPTQGADEVSAGDVLRAPRSAPAGASVLRDVTARELGLRPIEGCTPHPGTNCGADIDALSLGTDRPLPYGNDPLAAISFAVDRHARGRAGNGSVLQREAAEHEQCADVFTVPWAGLAHAPTRPPQASVELSFDGDGFSAFLNGQLRRSTVGLHEPNLPQEAWPMTAHDSGDQIDALAIDTCSEGDSGPEAYYFSLAGGLRDPLDPDWAPSPIDSAGRHGFAGGDVLRGLRGGAPSVYASARSLGLDRFGPSTDDLDALILFDDGDGEFEPAPAAYEWGMENQDMLVFSIRRGSATVGQFDSRLGLRITEGDLLVPPTVMGSPPGILVPAEWLGLFVDRSGEAESRGDDLSAADDDPLPFYDCNNNRVPDHLDIVDTTSYDNNMNGIPDECEVDFDAFCMCANGASSTCTNGTSEGGCGNAIEQAGLLVNVGSADLNDTFMLAASGIYGGAVAGLLTSSVAAPPVTLGNGLLCLGSPSAAALPTLAGPGGVALFGPGVFAGMDQMNVPLPAVGQTQLFQVWYRDLGGPCGGDINFTNGIAIQF